jgi:hypothetical protein
MNDSITAMAKMDVSVAEIEKTFPMVVLNHHQHQNMPTEQQPKNMDDQPPDSGDGDGQRGHPKDNGRGKGEPVGSPEKGEHREHSTEPQEDGRCQAGFTWEWSNKLCCLHHPKGCPVCREYCHHLLEDKMEQDDS